MYKSTLILMILLARSLANRRSDIMCLFCKRQPKLNWYKPPVCIYFFQYFSII
ncbi:hypothetical protein BD770DRAFT_385188 [Pilaira anomala]|nr:hypothetical protein BD770DRAFT_385188 [Pilaira anomala]